MLVVVNLRGLDLAIPASERIVSAGCAIQNVLLMAHAMGYGAGPTSGQAMYASHVRSFFKLSSEEEPLCFISIGTPERSKAGQPRMVPADFVKSL
jgi:nitroreductase